MPLVSQIFTNLASSPTLITPKGSLSAPLQEAASIDRLLADLPFPWLAPYFNLIAGHRKLCGEHVAEAERQLKLARDGKQPIVKVVAEHLLSTKRCRD